VEYTIERPGERKRHLLSVVGIGSNGWVNRLYTVSGQVHQLLSGPPSNEMDKLLIKLPLVWVLGG
jgi:hypothetical protein